MSVFVPLDFVVAKTSEDSSTPPMMVLCRAPADDGWLAIEAGSAVIYNVFDSVAHRYAQPARSHPGRVSANYPSHPDLTGRGKQSELLARARWFHHPAAPTSNGRSH
jgi:hypothetical protein